MKSDYEIKIDALWASVTILQVLDLEALAAEVRERGSDAERHLLTQAIRYRAEIDAYQAEEWG